MAKPPLIDIRPDHWGIVRDILHKHVPEREVWAFGSRARWTAKQYSDLDLAVLGDEPLNLGILAGLEEAFSESDLPFKVDVVDWATTAEAFRGIIEKGRVLVQEMGSKSPIPHPTEWPIVRIGDITSKVGSGAIPTGGNGAYLGTRTRFALIRSQNVFDRYFNPAGLAFISDEQAERLRGVILRPGDLLLNITGDGITFSRACAVPHTVLPACVNQHVAIVRVDNSVADPGYVLGYLTHPSVKSYIESFNAGGSRRAITKGNIESFHLPLPPLPEQRAIARILGALDDKIELNRRMNADLEAMAQSLFKDWFVDFGPVRTKVEGRPAYLAPEIWELFPGALDDEDKPVGWNFGSLRDVAISVGQVVDPRDMPSESPYIGLEHMPRHSIALDVWERADKVTSGKLIFRRGDFLFGKLRPYFHKVGIVSVNGICSTDIVVLRGVTDYYSAFVISCISSNEFVNFTEQTSDGTKMPRTSWERMSQFPLIIPSRPIAECFQNTIAPALDRILVNVVESRELAETRDLLLPKLITGKIRVRDAEKTVEVVL